MEIITIPLSGSVRHGDNMGNEEIITSEEVQVMSAGTGIWHSEFNGSDSDPLNLFQIWILTNQKRFSKTERINNWQLLVSPKRKNESLWIHQEAHISIIETTGKQGETYQLKNYGNGVYFMLIEGQAKIDEQHLKKRDAAGFWEITEPLKILFLQKSLMLAIEIPMH